MAPRFTRAVCSFILETVNVMTNGDVGVTMDDVFDFLAEQRALAKQGRPVVEKRRVGLAESRFCQQQIYAPSSTRSGKRLRDDTDEAELWAKRIMLCLPAAAPLPAVVPHPHVLFLTLLCLQLWFLHPFLPCLLRPR